MSKGYQINKEEGTIIVNIKNVDRIYNGSVHFMGNKVLADLSDADIEGITEMVEQYTGGISPEIVEELEAQIAQLNVQISELDAQIETLNTEISSLETENTELIAQRDELIAQKEQLEAQVAQLEQDVEAAYQRGYAEGYEDGSHPFKGLCFTAEEAGSTIKQNIGKSGCQYWTSTNSKDWDEYTLGTVITLTNVGDKVYWKGNGIYNSAASAIFVMTGKITASGSVISMIDEVGESVVVPTNNNFRSLFRNCASLTAVQELPATTLTTDCYKELFYGCTSLIEAPELPATELAGSCYTDMFSKCTSLTTAPNILPATTLKDSCYKSMFYGCTSLTTAPELPAKSLARECYYTMFYGCTSLTTAPELPAKSLSTRAYQTMFYNCSNLNYIKVGATSWITSYATGFVSGVSLTGTFVKPKDTVIPTGTSGIPDGWTVEIDGTYTEGYNDGYADGSAINTIIVDEDASNVWSGTLEEYQALTPADNIIYLIHE